MSHCLLLSYAHPDYFFSQPDVDRILGIQAFRQA
jgi:hypothetical protein